MREFVKHKKFVQFLFPSGDDSLTPESHAVNHNDPRKLDFPEGSIGCQFVEYAYVEIDIGGNQVELRSTEPLERSKTYIRRAKIVGHDDLLSGLGRYVSMAVIQNCMEHGRDAQLVVAHYLSPDDRTKEIGGVVVHFLGHEREHEIAMRYDPEAMEILEIIEPLNGKHTERRPQREPQAATR